MMTTNIVYGITWSVAGFIAGFSLCWFWVRPSLPVEDGVLRIRNRPHKGGVFRTAVGLVILLMMLFGSWRYYNVTNCQKNYNTEVAQALSDRSEAQRITSTAQVKLLQVTLQGNPSESRQAILDYIAALDNLEKVRLATPYPQPADCGDLK